VSRLPTREQFLKRSKGCGLSNAQIYRLYRLLRKSAILYDQHRRGSESERRQIEVDISGLLKDVEKSAGGFLKDFIARLDEDDLNIVRQARAKNYSSYALSRALLDHHAEIYVEYLEWKEKEREYLSRVMTRLEKRRQKALGSKTWKYGLLAGVTAVGVGAGIYLYSQSQNKKDDRNEEK
jgi:hypothetical protein